MKVSDRPSSFSGIPICTAFGLGRGKLMQAADKDHFNSGEIADTASSNCGVCNDVGIHWLGKPLDG